ncbi:3-isopropylmalate dehydratase [Aureococcus anophagefferens]|nr:3-isopropylmalate dehydratase [Aureococcus anophagefferens]
MIAAVLLASCASALVAPASRRAAPRTRMRAGLTLFDKIFRDHVVSEDDGGAALIYIDRHLVHEVTSPQAFEGLRLAGRPVRRPDCTLATVDHNVPTSNRDSFHSGTESVDTFLEDVASRTQVLALEENVADFVKYRMSDKRQGIVHIIGPEQGFTLPGTTCVCGDSHTATHGAFGALAFGIGEVEHVLATQTLPQKKVKNMLVRVDGPLRPGVTSKDIVLHVCGEIGTAGGTGCAIEFAGEAIRGLTMEGRMSISNMAIEAGARAGLIAPDQVTYDYLEGRPMCPTGAEWDAPSHTGTRWASADAAYDTTVIIDAKDIAPTVTWGTSPQDTAPITAVVPDPADAADPPRKAAMERSLAYMGLEPGTKLADVPVDMVFIGSCTNGRIEDMRAVAAVAEGGKSPQRRAMVVPGSGLVKEQAEAEGLDKILEAAGFEWREPGCSMCLAMNRTSSSPRSDQRRRHGRRRRRRRCRWRRHDAVRDATGLAAPLDIQNIDTDMIIPKEFLKTIKRSGLGFAAFAELRYENPDAPWQGAANILVAGDNFGCGSSREHAPWSINDMGIRSIISAPFADIFYNNCFKNGMLPIILPRDAVEDLLDAAAKCEQLTVDLPSQTVSRADGTGATYSFDVDPFRKNNLLKGLDDIGLTIANNADDIAKFEDKRSRVWPWLDGATTRVPDNMPVPLAVSAQELQASR